MTRPPVVMPGDIWRDLDPRGGPTFRVIEGPTELSPFAVWVESLDGKRPRYVLLKRFRHHDGYRSGYALVTSAQEASR